MEAFILIAKVSFFVALIAAIREGLRRKSETLPTIAILLMIPAILALIAETKDSVYRHGSGLQFTPEERAIAARRIAMESSNRPFEFDADSGVKCYFTVPAPSDAEFPEDPPSK